MVRPLFKNDKAILIVIFLFALTIRLWDLSRVPHGFHKDEVANTYIGRFILLTGQDIYGNSWPVFYVDKFGDYPPVLPMYLSGVATFLFQSYEFASRFPSAVFGSLLVLPLFLFLRLLFSRTVAIVGIILMAVLPWHVVLSRSSSEGIIALTVCTWGLYLLLSGAKEKHNKKLTGSLVLLLLTYLIYPSFRILVPLLLLPLPFFLAKGKEERNKRIILMLFFSIIATTLISSTAWGKGRFLQTSLFSNRTEAENLQNDITQHIFDDGTHPVLLTRVFHNKAVAYTQRFLELYIGYFSPSVYVVKGGLPARYAVPHVGLIPITVGLSIVMYLLFPMGKRERRWELYLLYLLIISPLPAVITVEDWPNIHRSVFMILPWIGFGAIAVVNVLHFLRRKAGRFARVAGVVIAGIVLIEMAGTSHQYFSHAGSHNSFVRNDGNIQMANFLIDNRDTYDRIYVTLKDWLPLYYLLYSGTYDRSLVGSFETDFALKRIENIEFVPFPCVSHERLKFFTQETIENILVVDNADCTVPQEYTVVDTITRRGGTEAYRVLAPIRKTP